MKLSWKASVSATCLHAAACFREGLPVADQQLASELSGPVDQFLNELAIPGLSPDEMLAQLVGLAGQVENNRHLAERALTRRWGSSGLSELNVSLLAGAVSDLESALLRTNPNLVEELAARGRPLLEQWESRGPGLLKQVAQLSDELVVAPSAEVVLVAPIVGGHGRAHLQGNLVTFEAVLVNPNPELPESLRLAWLLSQLNLDLPIFSENFPGQRLSLIAQLATLPLVLEAAEQLELAQADEQTLALAIDRWYLPAELPVAIGPLLQKWWQTYRAGSTRWPVALTALDAMLSEAMP